MGQRDGVVGPAAGATGELDDMVGHDPRLLGDVEAETQRTRSGASAKA